MAFLIAGHGRGNRYESMNCEIANNAVGRRTRLEKYNNQNNTTKMKNETKTFSEYKAPKCKEVALLVSSALLNDSKFGVAGRAGADTNVDYDGEEY